MKSNVWVKTLEKVGGPKICTIRVTNIVRRDSV